MMLSVLSALMLFISAPKELAYPDPKPKTTLNKTLLLRLVNDIRSKGCQCGNTYYNAATPLTWNDQLEQAAAAHSNDMQTKRYFGHTSPNGDNAGERIDRAGYSWMAFGENIGMGYRNEAEVVQAWKESPSHCKNLMDKKFKEMGVARTEKYWVQTFGSK